MTTTTATHTPAATVQRRRDARRRRGVEIIEFVVVFPLVLFLTMFVVDMGRLGFIIGAINDAAYTGARAAAAVGQTGGTGGSDCDSPSGLVADAFCDAILGIPGVPAADRIHVNAVPHPSSGFCEGPEGSSRRTVHVDVSADVSLFTPGLNGLLQFLSDDNPGIPDTMRVQTSAVVQCEVVVR